MPSARTTAATSAAAGPEVNRSDAWIQDPSGARHRLFSESPHFPTAAENARVLEDPW
jgi:hypothetical protein